MNYIFLLYVIFSHIAYFNNYRMYLHKKRQPDTYDKFNDTLLKYIGKYLELYDTYIIQISNDRKEVAEIMKNKMKLANNVDKYISIEA